MDLKTKVIQALRYAFPVDYVRLEDDDGLSGFVVSPRFKGMDPIDRQELIERAFSRFEPTMTPEEKRRVLAIAPLTPAEYKSLETKIRVEHVQETPSGDFDIFVYGTLADGEYVRGTLNNEKGILALEPIYPPGEEGTMVMIRARGKSATCRETSSLTF